MSERTHALGMIVLALALGLAAAAGPGAPVTEQGPGYLPRGTEAIQLRDECTRHYSNGDGTITAYVAARPVHRRNQDGTWTELERFSPPVDLSGRANPPPGTDDDENVYPNNLSFHTGTVDGGGGTPVFKYSSTIRFQGGAVNAQYRAWARFNTSGIQDGSTITGLVYYMYAYEISSPFYYITSMESDPPAQTAATIYADIADGNQYYSATSLDPGFNSYTLPAAARTTFQNQLPSNWFAVGIHEHGAGIDEYGTCYGHSGASYKPYIAVTYTPPPVPAPPVPELPALGSDVTTLTPGLKVTAIIGADRYEFEVYNSATDELVTQETVLVNTWTVSPALENAKEYWWQCRAENLVGWGNFFSPRWNFTTKVLPATPVPVTPGNGAVTRGGTPTLVVQAIADALQYHFEVYDTETEGLVTEGTVATNSWTVDVELTEEETYWWRCEAENAAGWGEFFDPRWSFVVGPPWAPGWQEVKKVPAAPTADKPPKDGAWLAKGPAGTDAGDVIYVAKGNKTTDFYMYAPGEGDSGTWYNRASIPAGEGTRTKPPSKGCVGVSDGTNYLYMTKGNNTLGFWRYDISTNKWDSMTGAGVPQGRYNKRVKGGTDMVFAEYQDTGCVYLLKGYKTEFYRYNPQAARWDTLPEVPYGANKQKYDKGSFLAYDGTNRLIYAHQAKYYDKAAVDPSHYMFKYDVEADSWYHAPLNGIPVYQLEGGREHKKKKSADGGSGVWVGSHLYALKGGNTQGFFKYFVAGDTWHQLDTVPGNGSFGKKKRVKAGGDLVNYGAAFFALKGNKTYEFWRYLEPTVYGLPPTAGRSGAMAERSSIVDPRLSISPNPIANGFATLRYNLPKPGPVSVTVFDVAGRSVFRQSTTGNRQSTMTVDLRKLAAGVYLVRLDAEGCSQTRKLVVQR